MVRKIKAEINKVYFINKYSLIHILEGTGQIQVDFKNYDDWANKAIFLEKGQYIKFLSDDFILRIIEFPDDALFYSKDVRILFKHLISLGYINYDECSDCKLFLDNSVFNSNIKSLIDISTRQWYWQNPFNAEKDEYSIIFDIKDVIDSEFKNHLSTDKIIDLLENTPFNPQRLVKNKLGVTIKKMILDKRLLESQKAIAFTGKNIQEVAFANGYEDPAYFNRFFKNKLGITPLEFREGFELPERETFVQDIIDLIQRYHKEEHKLQFYADKMHLSVKTLSKKVRTQLQTSLGQLIRSQIILSAKSMLDKSESVKEVAYDLGFEEANHFSSFFSKYTGETPSAFRN